MNFSVNKFEIIRDRRSNCQLEYFQLEIKIIKQYMDPLLILVTPNHQ